MNKQTDSELAELYEYKQEAFEQETDPVIKKEMVKRFSVAVRKTIEWNKKATNEDRQ